MKILKLFLIGIIAISFGCKDGYIDPISKVDPGEDSEAPVVILVHPTEDVIIPFTDEQTNLEIEFEVTDDIEISSVVLSVDGSQDTTLNDFKDYRRVASMFTHNNLGLGEHTVQVKATDMAGKETNTSLTFEVSNKYLAKYDGEVFYMPFEGGLYMDLLSETNATVVGSPTFVSGKSGKAYKGAADTYLTFPIDNFTNEEFSATMWYKLDVSPDRAGIISISPAGEDRTKGLRFFREGSAAEQRFKLNVGNGSGEQWNDGGTAAPTGEWVHLAFTISENQTVVYINGEVATSTANSGIDWTGLTTMSIGSGLPNFAYWGHGSDSSLIDDLRFYSKALTQDEVKATMN